MDDQWEIDPSRDVQDDGWWGEPGTRPTRKELGAVFSSRHQGTQSNRGVRSRDCAMAEVG